MLVMTHAKDNLAMTSNHIPISSSDQITINFPHLNSNFIVNKLNKTLSAVQTHGINYKLIRSVASLLNWVQFKFARCIIKQLYLNYQIITYSRKLVVIEH